MRYERDLITFYLSRANKTRLDNICAIMEKTRTSVLHDLIDAYIRTEGPKALELARKMRLMSEFGVGDIIVTDGDDDSEDAWLLTPVEDS